MAEPRREAHEIVALNLVEVCEAQDQLGFVSAGHERLDCRVRSGLHWLSRVVNQHDGIADLITLRDTRRHTRDGVCRMAKTLPVEDHQPGAFSFGPCRGERTGDADSLYKGCQKSAEVRCIVAREPIDSRDEISPLGRLIPPRGRPSIPPLRELAIVKTIEPRLAVVEDVVDQ